VEGLDHVKKRLRVLSEMFIVALPASYNTNLLPKTNVETALKVGPRGNPGSLASHNTRILGDLPIVERGILRPLEDIL